MAKKGKGSVKVNVTVDAEYNKKIDKRMNNAFGAAYYQKASEIMSQSILQVPVYGGDDWVGGRLRSSAYVSPPRNNRVELGYGTVYARRQHEEETWQHTTGKAKYLSDPIDDARAGFEADMAKLVGEHVAKGSRWGGGAFPTKPRPKGGRE